MYTVPYQEPQHIRRSRGKRLSVLIPSCSYVYSTLSQYLIGGIIAAYSRSFYYSLLRIIFILIKFLKAEFSLLRDRGKKAIILL